MASLLRSIVVSLAVVGALLALTASSTRVRTKISSRAPATYGYKLGGSDWGLSCASGSEQSPINVDVPEGQGGLDSEEIDFHYPPLDAWTSQLKLTHTGAALELTGKEFALGYIQHNNRKYYVRNVVFHAPSEHTIRGERFDMEMQIVHQRNSAKNDDDLIIVSALFRVNVNATARFLSKRLVWMELPKKEGQRTLLDGPFQLSEGIMGLHQGYYQYVGSTTAPPCSGGVTWNILESIQDMTPSEARAINDLFMNNVAFAQGQGNNRPIQPRLERNITLHNHKQVGDGDERPAPRRVRDPNAAVDKNDGLEADPEKPNPNLLKPKDLPATVPDLYALGGDDWSGACRYGRIQSPINIQLNVGNPHGDFEVQPFYKMFSGVRSFNDANTIKITGEYGKILVGKKVEYDAAELSFHTPAEHLIDGRQPDFEMQILHKRRKGNATRLSDKDDYAIISVLFVSHPTKSHKIFDSLMWELLPGKGQSLPNPRRINLYDIEGLENMNAGYYSYAGSLTTPPCTEGVKWFVLRHIQYISASQLAQFRRLFTNNNRKVQPLNGRGVTVQHVQTRSEIFTTPREVLSDGTLLPLS